MTDLKKRRPFKLEEFDLDSCEAFDEEEQENFVAALEHQDESFNKKFKVVFALCLCALVSLSLLFKGLSASLFFHFLSTLLTIGKFCSPSESTTPLEKVDNGPTTNHASSTNWQSTLFSHQIIILISALPYTLYLFSPNFSTRSEDSLWAILPLLQSLLACYSIFIADTSQSEIRSLKQSKFDRKGA